jgi:hypothetical protein
MAVTTALPQRDQGVAERIAATMKNQHAPAGCHTQPEQIGVGDQSGLRNSLG